ncbi:MULTISPECIES: hypothetical protein [unclassified Legionella]|uniref:hypothetical protein n=1 Tax=unclassified Legionella TaxID=2622702 RepID=UPI001E49BC3D|nr:hypothetical protein [Legionella sp. 31fI33]MCC5015221.1 hypothetical protein [Legionella sp. 31fI33]
MANYNASFFYFNAKKELTKATELLGLEYETAIQPYYTVGYHATAVFYPFVNAFKCFMGVGRIIVGTLLFFEAIFNNPTKAIPRVLGGLVFEVGALIINIINTAVTIITLLSRTMETIFNSGYLSRNLLQTAAGVLTGGVNSGRQLVEAISSEDANSKARQQEDSLYQASMSF